jgi:hypothetical protein
MVYGNPDRRRACGRHHNYDHDDNPCNNCHYDNDTILSGLLKVRKTTIK